MRATFLEISLFYARAGASISLVGRKHADLLEVKTRILAQTPNAPIAIFVADVVDTQAVKAAVDGTVKTFGKLDIAVANAGKADPWNKRKDSILVNISCVPTSLIFIPSIH